MKRSIVLAVVLGVGALSLAIVEAQDAMVIEVEQLEDNLYVLRGQGGGGNTAVFVTSNGVVVVDSKNPGWGQSILDAIGELTSNPVTTLVNTHSHHDHVSGNVAFPASVDIVTHEVTAANMQVMRAYSGRTEPPANVFADSMGRGLPTQTFSERMSIGTGDDRVDLYHFGRGPHRRRRLDRLPGARDAPLRRHLPGQEPALPRRQQRRQRRRHPGQPAEGARQHRGCRHDHHRAQHADDVAGPARVRGVQPRLPGRGAGGARRGPERRRDREPAGRCRTATRATGRRRRPA